MSPYDCYCKTEEQLKSNQTGALVSEMVVQMNDRLPKNSCTFLPFSSFPRLYRYFSSTVRLLKPMTEETEANYPASFMSTSFAEKLLIVRECLAYCLSSNLLVLLSHFCITFVVTKSHFSIKWFARNTLAGFPLTPCKSSPLTRILLKSIEMLRKKS